MIVFCGYANVDLTVAVPELPGPGARVQATGVRRGEGGMAANAAVAAARMGAAARFAGVVGPGASSTAFLASLAADGVGTDWTARTGTLTTAVVLLTPDGERSIISQDDEVTTGHIAGVVRSAREAGAGWLYLDGYRFPEAAAVLGDPGGPRVVVDLDGCDGPGAMRAALASADHAIVGRAQATAFLGGDGALAAEAAAHRVNLVVTDGARGWTLFTPDGGRHSGAAIAVTAVDATGAGDCFAGAYCAELDRGAAPLDAARVAAVAAGLSCTRPGARDGLPHRDAVLAYLDAARPGAARPDAARDGAAHSETAGSHPGTGASGAPARSHGEEA
ncbi:carbohydrate kinase family protein [Actinomadura rubrisoli]|uniref:Carbohydrate kinase family protein n=1 Tax=Actinomadura rubrisoli TaxID=2530368 RepID=A0A4R5AK13_9ACTN|nr:carbohydrate kinase family protein [Actinomadura rubrisoli]TDD71789.1 carbohydrate kinase family protein [Actinomadura rubrisoli]